MRRKEITLESGATLEIKAVPLGKYPELLEALEFIPNTINEFDKQSEEEIIKSLPKTILSALPEVYKIVTIATPLKAEEINELVISDLVNIVMTIWEVNSYADIMGKIKKVLMTPKAGQKLISPTNGDGGQ